MKLKLNLLKKEASVDADVEKIIEKSIDSASKKPPKKTRYQIKQEEKRKNMELKHKQEMHEIYIMLGALAVIFLIIFLYNPPSV